MCSSAARSVRDFRITDMIEPVGMNSNLDRARETRLLEKTIGGIVFYRIAGLHSATRNCSAAGKSNSKIENSKASRPNIVVIVCDDMGFSDISCYGSEIETPNLNRLAEDEIRFVDFHSHAKYSETRASLMTGLWHQQSRN